MIQGDISEASNSGEVILAILHKLHSRAVFNDGEVNFTRNEIHNHVKDK